jgi:hypothetical protein
MYVPVAFICYCLSVTPITVRLRLVPNNVFDSMQL